MNKARKRFNLITTFKNSNKHSAVPQYVLKMLPSWPNAQMHSVQLQTLVILVYSLEFFSRNCWNFTVDIVSLFLQSVSLQLDHVSSQLQLPMSFVVPVLIILWSFVLMITKQSLPEAVIWEICLAKFHVWYEQHPISLLSYSSFLVWLFA